MSPLAHLLALPVRAYRLVASPWVGHACRFQPTCSAYALEALERHGALRGTALMLRRIGLLDMDPDTRPIRFVTVTAESL